MLACLYYFWIRFISFFSYKKKVNFKSNEVFIIKNNQQILDEEIGNKSIKRTESKIKMLDTFVGVNKSKSESNLNNNNINLKKNKKTFSILSHEKEYVIVWRPFCENCNWGFSEKCRIKDK
jgi:hypothetical protein